jgi:pseudouridine-5'-phosphate glycosidase
MKHPSAEQFIFDPEVREALHDDQPLVALESTVITHGLPYPHNLTTAQSMERAVREAGAIPATIAILSGQVHIGLSSDQLEMLAQAAGKVRKCSRRDLALILAAQEHGGTTVAATMLLAHRAGLQLFATGGIGGVHRGHPFDVSADLTELGRTPMTVVCSGAKSILDLPATLEVLETRGVPVIGYGTDEMPAFFSRQSGLPVSARLDEPAQVAAVIKAQRQLQLQSGILVTVPVPDEAEFDAARAEAAIDQAVREADAQGIQGAATTPWLLERISALSGGESLQANVALLANNGRVAAQIAVALASI